MRLPVASLDNGARIPCTEKNPRSPSLRCRLIALKEYLKILKEKNDNYFLNVRVPKSVNILKL
jgi:hypothetical protein